MDCYGSQHHYSQHADANHDVAVTGTVNLIHLLAQTVGVKLRLVAGESVGGGGGIQRVAQRIEMLQLYPRTVGVYRPVALIQALM